MKLEIELQVADADSMKFYVGSKYDESGNIIGENTAEERQEWFDQNKGKIRHRLIAQTEDKRRKVFEGPAVSPSESNPTIEKLFESLGSSVASLV